MIGRAEAHSIRHAVFSKAKEMYVYLQAYEPGRPRPRQPLLAFVTFYQGQAGKRSRPRRWA